MHYTDVIFPVELISEYGLNEKLLKKCVDAIGSGERPLWTLQKTPKVRFYQLLHQFLKQWPLTRRQTKIFIGKVYLAIDENFHRKRPDNVYRYVDSMPKTLLVPSALMSYSSVLQQLSQLPDGDSESISSLTDEMSKLKKELNRAKKNYILLTEH